MRYTGVRRGEVASPNGVGEPNPLRRIMRVCSALIRIQNLNVTTDAGLAMNCATTNQWLLKLVDYELV